MRASSAIATAITVLVLAGCQKAASSAVLYDKTVEIEGAEFNEIEISAPKGDQKVTITASSSTGNFSVYVVLNKDLSAAKQQLGKQEPVTASTLGKQTMTKQAALEVTVRAGQAFTVLIANESGKRMSVALKIVNVP